MRRQPERVEQRQIVALLRHLGAKVYVLGTTRKRSDFPGTMQTPGLPDLMAYVPKRLVYGTDEARIVMCDIPDGTQLLMVEVKAPGGKRTVAQEQFAEQCDRAGIAYLVGGFTTVVAWALGQGLLEGTPASWRIPLHRLLA